MNSTSGITSTSFPTQSYATYDSAAAPSQQHPPQPAHRTNGRGGQSATSMSSRISVLVRAPGRANHSEKRRRWDAMPTRPSDRVALRRQPPADMARRRVTVRDATPVRVEPSQPVAVVDGHLVPTGHPLVADRRAVPHPALVQEDGNAGNRRPDRGRAVGHAAPRRTPAIRCALQLRRERIEMPVGALLRHRQVMPTFLARRATLSVRPARRHPRLLRRPLTVPRARPTRDEIQHGPA
jgi:hypothetical protein